MIDVAIMLNPPQVRDGMPVGFRGVALSAASSSP